MTAYAYMVALSFYIILGIDVKVSLNDSHMTVVVLSYDKSPPLYI